jgi:glycosyltransferase involved in cell wall biosynthesis
MKILQDIIISEIINILSVLFPIKPLKIAMISYYYPTSKNQSVSGVAIYTYFISRELAKLGYKVHVFTSSEKESKISKCILGKGNLVVHEISTFSRSKEKDPVAQKRIKYLDFENKIPKEISKENKKGKFDIINTNGWLTSGAFMIKQFLGVKWVHTFHAVEIRRENMMADEEKKYINLYEWIERTIKHADYFIAVSEALKHEIIRTYNISSDKITVIPNGIDPNIFKPRKLNFRKKYGFSRKQKIIMTVSRFSKEKGIETLIKMIPYVLDKDSNTAFLLVLPERRKSKIETYVKLIKYLKKLIIDYKNRIRLISKPVSQKTLSKLYNMADLYIQPSLYESFGITILEAMACGKAVVATDCGGIPEIVFNGYNGLLVKPDNAEELARDILKILDNYEFKRKMEKNSMKFAQKYNWNIIGKRTLELYQKL